MLRKRACIHAYNNIFSISLPVGILFLYVAWEFDKLTVVHKIPSDRPSQLAELSRSECDPELFSHISYLKFFVKFATKVPYLTFCDKMRPLLIEEMDREGGN